MQKPCLQALDVAIGAWINKGKIMNTQRVNISGFARRIFAAACVWAVYTFTAVAQIPVARVVGSGGVTTNLYTSLDTAIKAAGDSHDDVTVTLLADIDLTNTVWDAASLNGYSGGFRSLTLDGNGKSIAGLSDTLIASTWVGQSLTIKNLTIKKSAIVRDAGDSTGTTGVGAFFGILSATHRVTLEDCHLVDSSVEGGHWTGGLIGYATGYSGTDGPVFESVLVTNCSVSGCSVTGKGSAGGVIGHATGDAWTEVVIADTAVSNNTVTSTGTSTIKAGSVIGTVGVAGAETTVNGTTHTGGIGVSAEVSGNTVKSNGTGTDAIFGRFGNAAGVLRVTGGVYDGAEDYAGLPIAGDAAGTLLVSGGTYETLPDAGVWAEGFVAYASGDDTYTVREVDGSAVYVDDDFTEATKGWNNYRFKTIQGGVNTVAASGTVYIAAGTYTENVYVGKSLNIVGAGAATTIVDGHDAGSVFIVDGDIDVAIEGLTIQNGGGTAATYGAGVYAEAAGVGLTLSLVDCVLKDNTAVTSGGGLATGGWGEDVTLIGTTISGNTASGTGPGAGGGGIYTYGGELTVENCTVSGNTAARDGGGVFLAGATACQINFATFTGNTANRGGGLSLSGASGAINNTIVCGNTDAIAGTVSDNVNGTIPGGSNNLVDQDAKLVALADNGGPTPTHALLADSPALNAGMADTVAFDQRGVPRAQGNAPDIGAFETVRIVYVDDDWTGPENVVGHAWGQDAFPTLTAAMAVVPDGGLVRVADGTYAGGQTITGSLTFEGANKDVAGYGTRGAESVITSTIHVKGQNNTVSFNGFQFTASNYALLYGAAPSTTDWIFKNNLVAGGSGCACYNEGTSNWRDVTVVSNMFTVTGGSSALRLANVRNLSVKDNRFTGGFNALQLVGASGDVLVDGNEISNTTNEALKFGGPILNGMCSNNTISNANTSREIDVGAIRIRGVTLPYSLTIINNTLIDSFNGVAVRDGDSLAGATILVTENVFEGNSNAGVYNGGTGALTANGNYWGETTPNMAEHVAGDVTVDTYFAAYDAGTGVFSDLNVLTVYVDGSLAAEDATHFKTLAGAVAAVAPGGTIHVAAGTYNESVTLAQPVSLVGPTTGDKPLIVGMLTATHTAGWATTIENIDFKVNATDKNNLKLVGVKNLTVKGCDFDADERFMALPQVVAVQLDSACQNITFDACTFRDGYYVTIQGRADNLVVKNCTLENVKSGINMQYASGAGLTVTNTGISVVAQGVANDTYCVRFGSSSGTAQNLTIIGGSLTVDANGLTPDAGTYFHAILVREAASGTLAVTGTTINGEIANLSATPLAGVDNLYYVVYVDDDYTAATSGWGQYAFASIQDAVNAVQANGKIAVAAGTYTQSVTVSKPLNLVAVGEAIIVGTATDAVTVAADGVSISGFTVQNPNGVHGIYALNRNDLSITGNTVENVGSGVAAPGSAVCGVMIYSTSAAMNDIAVVDNMIRGIRSQGNKTGANGVWVGDSSGNFDITGLVIQGNVISNIVARPIAYDDGGRGAYGIIINHASTGTGQTVAPLIKDNLIADLDGVWAHAVGLEGNTPGAVVQGNIIARIIDHKSPANPDAVGIMVEANPAAASVSIVSNSFSEVLAGVRNVTAIAVTVNGNYWGSATPNIDALVLGDVVTDSFYADAALTDLRYFTVFVDGAFATESGNRFKTIQGGVDAVSQYGNVHVAAGSYDGATLTKSVNLLGANAGVAGYGTRADEAVITSVVNMTGKDTTVMIDGFKFNVTPHLMFGANNAESKQTADWTFQNNLVEASGAIYSDTGYVNLNWRDVVVTRNRFANMNSNAVSTFNVRSLTATDNQFDTLGAGANALVCQNIGSLTAAGNSFSNIGWNAVQLVGSTSVTITNNVCSNLGAEAFKLGGPIVSGVCSYNHIVGANTSNEVDVGGIRIRVAAGQPYNVAIIGNYIENSFNGLAVRNGDVLADTSITVSQNTFVGNSHAGIYNGSTGTLAASCNYWGTAFGPSGIGYFGTGDAIIGPVTIGNYYVSVPLTTLHYYDLYVDGNGSEDATHFKTIQAAYAAANPGDTIHVAAGTYVQTGTLTLAKPGLTLTGASRTDVCIDVSACGSAWGIHVEADDVTLEHFTVIPENETGGGYPIHAAPEPVKPGVSIANLVLRDIAISGSYRTAFDLHAVNGATLDGLSALNTARGNGIQITGCTDVTLTGCTTSGNVWGGVALYNSSYSASSCVNVTADLKKNSFGEIQAIYVQDPGVSGLNITGYSYVIASSATTTFADGDVNEAIALALVYDGQGSTVTTITDAAGNPVSYSGETGTDVVYVDGSWAGTPNGAGIPKPRAAGTYLQFGRNAFSTVQNGVAGVDVGGTVHVEAGSYTELVAVAKALTLVNEPALSATVTAPGAASKAALVTVDASNVTVDGFVLAVNQPDATAGIFMDSTAADPDTALTVQNCRFTISGTIDSAGADAYIGFGTYSTAIAVNGAGGFPTIQLLNNEILPDSTTAPTAMFDRAIFLREGKGTISGNTVYGDAHDLCAQFVSNGQLLISGNRFLGKGGRDVKGAQIDFTEPNGTGSIVFQNNTVEPFAEATPSGSAHVRSLMVKNNMSGAEVNVLNNLFTNVQAVAVLAGNSKSMTISGNEFRAADGDSDFSYVQIGNKVMTGASPAPVQMNAVIQGNVFCASTMPGGRAIEFLNHNATGATFGTITVGGAGALANTFAAGLDRYIHLDNEVLGDSKLSARAAYAACGTTVMAPFSAAIDATQNLFDVGTGAQLPAAMAAANLFSLEDKIYHATDVATLGLVRVNAANVYVTTASGSIQRGVDAAFAGDTVNVAAGTFDESVSITKPLQLSGANAGVAWGSRGPESKIQQTGGNTLLTVRADNVTVNGFELYGPLSNNAVTSDNGTLSAPTGRSNLTFVFNHVHDIGTTRGSGNIYGFHYMLASDAPANITVADNLFENIGNSATLAGSAGAVYFGQSTSTGKLSGVLVERNVVRNVRVTASTKNAWGIIIGTGWNSSGYVEDAIIRNNDVAQVTGGIAAGISLGGNTPGATVSNNLVRAVNIGVMVETNTGAATVNIVGNSLEAEQYGVLNNTAAMVKAENNWFGSSSGPSVATNPGGTGVAVSGPVEYSPWLGYGTDLDPAAAGFQPIVGTLLYAPVGVAFITQPVGNVGLGLALSRQPVLAVTNETGNVATQFTGNVTLAFGSNPNNGVLGGVLTQAAVGGVAAFTDLSVTVGGGSGFTLAATAAAPIQGTESATFEILNPLPVLSSISQLWTAAGSAQFTLTLTGSGFVPTSRVLWNGAEHATAFVDATTLTAVIPAGDVASAGTAQVKVVTPAAGGGESAARTFTVTATAQSPVVYVDDDWTGFDNCDGHVWGYDAFKTLQGGLDGVAQDGTVNLLEGNYAENASAAKRVKIIGALGGGGQRLATVRGAISIDNDESMTDGTRVENLNFVVSGGHALKLYGVNGGVVKNCSFDGANQYGNAFNGIEFVRGSSNGNGANLVEGCAFGNGLYVAVSGYCSSLTVKGCVIGGFYEGGINLQSGGDLAVENSEISVVARTAAGAAYGIRFAPSTGGPVNNMSITESSIGFDPSGLAPNAGVYHAAVIVRPAAGGALKLAGCSIGGPVVNLSSSVTLDASGNWWGGADAAAVAAKILAGSPVDYTPWLGDGTDTDGGAVGFKGDFSTLYVGDAGAKAGAAGRIQEGVDLLADGALTGENRRVNVLAGNYDVGVNVTKSVTFIGANAGIAGTGTRGAESVIDGADAVSPTDIAFKVCHPNLTVVVDGFMMTDCSPLDENFEGTAPHTTDITFRNNLVSSGTAIQCGNGGNTCWRNVTVADNKFMDIDMEAQSSAIVLNGCDLATVTDNVFLRMAYNAIQISDVAQVVVSRNSIDTTQEQAIQLAGVVSNGLVCSNEIANANVLQKADKGGIRLYGSQFAGPVSITGNIISGSYNGIAIKDGQDITGKLITISNNNLVGNSNAGIYHGGTGTLNAENNWFGSLSGPANAANPGGTGAAVIGAVDFSPWLGLGTDTQPAVIGFQPNATPVYYTPKYLVFSTQPGFAALGGSLVTQPVVTVMNEINQPALQYTGPVYMALGVNPGSGTLSGVTNLACTAGVATFDGLAVTVGGGSGLTLVASTTSPILGATSAAFDVANPAPTAGSLSPYWTRAGSGDVTVTVTGTGFTPTSVVKWNSADLVTTFVSATEVRAVVPEANVASIGTADIVVFTPAAGGGTSTPVLVFRIEDATPDVVYVDDGYAGMDPDTVVNWPVGAPTVTGRIIGYDAFATVQAGVTNVFAGGTVHVAAGMYAEQVIVNKAATLLGPYAAVNPNTGVRLVEAEALLVPPSVLNAASSPREWNEDAVLKIAADGVVVKGFTISGDNPLLDGYDYAGMDVEAGQGVYSEGNNVVFQNNIVEKFTYIGVCAGVHNDVFLSYAGLVLEGNLIRNVHDLNQLGYGYALYVQGTAGSVQNNVIVNSRIGIQIQPYRAVGVVPPVFSGNTVSAWRNGIYYNYAEVGASAWTISGNTVTACQPPAAPTGPVVWEGISVETMRDTGNGGTISGNSVDGTLAMTDACHAGWGGFAHAVWGLHYKGAASTSTKVYFTGNTVANVSFGVVHDAPADIVLTGNSLSAMDSAIRLQRTYSSAGVAQTFGGTNNVDATGGNIINGVDTTAATLTQLYAIEDAIVHKVDDPTWGLVRVRAANLYVTASSGSIQRGIDAATVGDTVNVGAGTYKEQVSVPKGLTVVGDEANPGVVVIDGENKTALPSYGQVRIYNPTGPVLFKGFTLTNVACVAGSDYFGILTKGSQPITIQACRVFGHRSAVDIGCDYGMWAAGGTGALTVSGCYFRDMYHAILLERQFGATTIEGNTFDSLYTGEYSGAQYGGRAIEAIVYGATDVTALQTIRGNSFVNFKSTGVLFSGGFSGQTPGKFTNVLIEENDFTFSATDIVNLLGAVCLKNVSGTSNDSPAGGVAAVVQNNNISVPSGSGIIVSGLNGAITISENSFTGNLLNAVKADQSLGSTISAENNWWGDSTGPANVDNPGGIGNAVVGGVDFSPWLADGTDTSAAIGFQPNIAAVFYRPVSLRFSQQPVGANLGFALVQQPKVEVIDENGGVATQFNGQVTIAIAANPGVPVLGVLAGTTNVTVVSGVATFAGLAITEGSGNGYTLVASAATPVAPATSLTFNIANNEPVLDSVGAKSVDEEKTLTFTATASDLDAPPQALTFTLAGTVPAGAAIDPATGVFTWTPTEAQGNTPYTFDVVVTDNGGPAPQSDSETITVTVNEVNVAPELDTVGNKGVNEEVELTFTATASDHDLNPAQTLRFSLVGTVPAGAAIDPVTGVFTWTPTEEQGDAAYTFDVVVTDNGKNGTTDAPLTDSETITVTVAEVNVAPVLGNIPPQSVNFGQTLTFTATATDHDREPTQSLTFSLTGAPEGTAIDPETGVFTWTPTEAQAKQNYSFTVTVTDNGVNPVNLSDSQTVTIGAVSASHTSPGYRSPSTSMVVSNRFDFGGTPDGLTWTPVLPNANWIITAADAGGNGVAEVSNGTAVVFTTLPTTSPAVFTYTVSVPGDQAVSNSLGAAVSFSGLTADVAPIAIFRYHSADYRRDLSGVTAGQFRKIDSTEINRVLSYWRFGYKPDAAGYDGFSAAAGYAGTEAAHHSADFNNNWIIDGNELLRVQTYWRGGGYQVYLGTPDGYAADQYRTGTGPGLYAMARLPVASQAAPSGYNPGETLQVTYTLNTAGASLLALGWAPELPEGWVIENVSGDASPMFARNEIICGAAVLPTATATVTVTVRVPLTETRTVTLGGAARLITDSGNDVESYAVESVALAPVDGDSNGMADAWEKAYAGGAGSLDPQADLDGDRLSNFEEYLCGTVPTDAQSVLKMVSLQALPDGATQISWASVAGRVYTLQRADGSPEAANFKSIKTGIAADPSGRNVCVDDADRTQSRFYRVLLQD